MSERTAATRQGPAGVPARVAAVRRRIAAAAGRAGRDPAEVTLVAAAKLQPVAAVRAAVAAGVPDIGENYAQELTAKAAAVDGARWHFIGRLQRNKARALVAANALVHSLDSLASARALGRRALEAGTVARALVQVELDERAAAHGVPVGGLDDFIAACRAVEGLELGGLMLVPAPAASAEDERPVFRRLAELPPWCASAPRFSVPGQRAPQKGEPVEHDEWAFVADAGAGVGKTVNGGAIMITA